MGKNLSTYLLYILITVLVMVLYLGDFGGLRKLQWKLDGLLYSLRGEEAIVSDIILVNIDQASLNKYGEWPWSYDMMADVIAACNTGGPKAILVDLDLTARISEDTTANTEILANQISWSDNIILPYDIALADYAPGRMSKPEFLWKNSIQMDYNQDILAEQGSLIIRKPFLPSGKLCQYADGLGFSYVEFDDDRRVRWAPLMANYDGYYYPSAPLLTAAAYLGNKSSDLIFKAGKSVQFGGHQIPIDDKSRVYINYNTESNAFRQLSVVDLFREKADLSQLQNSLVIVGITSSYGGEGYPTPIAARMPRSILSANIIENIIHDDYINLLELPTMVNILILLGIGALCALLLPRIQILYRIISLAVFAIILANISFVLFNNYGMLTRPLYVGLQILLFMVAAPMLDQARLNRGLGFSPPTPTVKTKKKPARTITSHPGDVPVRELKEDINAPEFQKTEMMETMPSRSGQEMDSRQTSERSKILSSGETHRPVDLSPDDPADKTMSQTPAADQEPPPLVISTTGTGSLSIGSSSSSPSFAGSGEVEKISHLGRYQVSEILGKGAMGTVFKGVDPAIGRPVALKTIRLDFVSDETEMAELRDRLQREAQAAGKLSHPNIVTIYDAGSEGTLQYIAMEYLEGQTLEQLIKKRVQFSYKIIANIILQICDALDYAHNQGIIHRDIKPANIMVLSNYGVKVMDFGIARIDTSSMTRTGIAMGTPNYIAPELLQGKDVDRRCDIYSLGVVIYELLTGRRPFKGENLTSLVYSIVNDVPPPPSTINDNMPLIFDHITAKALAKSPVDRYQKASDLKLALKDFIGSFGEVKKVGI